MVNEIVAMGTGHRRPDDCFPVLEVFDFSESPLELLREVVRDNTVDNNTSARDVDRNKLPEELKQHYRDCLDAVDYKYDEAKWRYWTGMVHPGHVSNRVGWAKGFPHNHQWDGLTCVHYVQLPDSGGDTVVFEDDAVTEKGRVTPELGTTVVLDGWCEHGVEEVFGETDRMTIIATGYR